MSAVPERPAYALLAHMPADAHHPMDQVFLYGPFPTEKAADEWREAQPVAWWPYRVIPLFEPVPQAWCGHCDDIGPAGSDHTCPCPNRDEDCQQHPMARRA